MKGDAQVIEALNGLLTDELTAIMQYTVHAEMCDNWHYQRLHDAIEARARAEMKHAARLVSRILFLEGAPEVQILNAVRIGPAVPALMINDREAEVIAHRGYNAAIELCVALKDNVSRALCESNLCDEEDHLDWIEGQLAQIEQAGIQNYLAVQL